MEYLKRAKDALLSVWRGAAELITIYPYAALVLWIASLIAAIIFI